MATMASTLSDQRLSQLSELIAAQMGLSFPSNRWRDLEHGIERAAAELGFPNAVAAGNSLVLAPLAPRQIDVLARHLTVGETYFFREKRSFDILEQQILPELIHARRGSAQRLRIWSAGCCTGEEPYSIAILLRTLIPDWQDWQISILATDINSQFLRKAAAGVYSKWSFREAATWANERYIKTTSKGQFEVLPEIRQMVTFARLNLAADDYPSPVNNTAAMDLIFCRNVLMYFAPDPMKTVVEKLQRSLADGGWLIVSPTETSPVLAAHFVPVHFPEATLYRHVRRTALAARVSDQPAEDARPTLQSPYGQLPASIGSDAPWPAEILLAPAPEQQGSLASQPLESEAPPATLEQQALAAYEHGRYAEAVAKAAEALSASPDEPNMIALSARICANEGKLVEALAWCERAIATDRLDAGHYYLLAVIQQEQGQDSEAMSSLRRALYLDPEFILARYILGNLTLRHGKRKESARHFDNILALLDRYGQEDLLPEADGLTAGRLRHMIISMPHDEA